MKDLPPSTLDNLDDANMFEHFYWDLLDIEADRAVKYQVLLKVGQEAVEELQEKIRRSARSAIDLREEQEAVKQFTENALRDFIVGQILNTEHSEEEYKDCNQEAIYNELLKSLRPGTKWNQQITN